MQTPDGKPQQAPGGCWLRRFDKRVAASPDQVALVADGWRLTYHELHDWVGRVCAELTRAGVTKQDAIAVVVPDGRSPYTTAAMLAIWRLGAVYVPMTADQPVERTRAALTTCAVRVAVLEPGELPPHLPDGVETHTLPYPGEADTTAPDLGRYPNPEDVAYIIFTAGSTGTPKCVAVPHRGITAMGDATARALELGPGARMLQFSAATFDASIAEVTSTLGSGATAVFVEHERLTDGASIAEVFVTQNITHAILGPSVLAAIPERQMPQGLRLIVAGEPANAPVIAEWSVRHHIVNSYGPTETTVCATISDPLVDVARHVPIGRAIDGTRLRIVDNEGRDVPAGNVGELWIGGLGVANGYVGLPRESAAAFVDHAQTGERFYRSGDLVWQLPDGQLEFVGRMDRRIKLRGRRIEPGEIEAVAVRHPDVRQCAVVATDAQLVCFVVTAGEVSGGEIRRFLAERLLRYMQPDRVHVLAQMPRTPHGKVDYRSLTASAKQHGRARPAPATMTPIEHLLCGLFAETLDLPRFHPDDSFFDLGGESMLATRLARRIKGEFGVAVTMRMLLDAESPAALAALFSARNQHGE
ncbi:non-ribosomal peptide synthetase [Nocardia iowensis]|uniref:non-ribosomal peptide synthetase n=1 Tax=Nocardia iowensis TaxID=204891 RepID=UPI002484C124|nr:non-ribosomal peptide synthetase [Nocardia iowensis]